MKRDVEVNSNIPFCFCQLPFADGKRTSTRFIAVNNFTESTEPPTWVTGCIDKHIPFLGKGPGLLRSTLADKLSILAGAFILIVDEDSWSLLSFTQ